MGDAILSVAVDLSPILSLQGADSICEMLFHAEVTVEDI
jgi:hypothetical protein